MSTETDKNTPKSSGYLGLSFQMGIMIFVGVYGGIKLDEKTGGKYVFTILFSILAVALSMYYIIQKETYKKKKDG
jgi:uncharacterized membrane protein YfcA